MELAYQHFKSNTNPYSDKVVLIADACSGAKGEQEKYDDFKSAHKELIEGGRYFELPQKSLEEYYPGTYKADPNVIGSKPRGKDTYAETVSLKLSQKEFEQDMKVLHLALEKAKEKSFGNH
jgi:hypothetical protein